MEADITTQAVGLASSADFSLMNLFIRADIIVKSVIILLIACSIYSWALIFDKFKLFKSINKSTEDFEKKFWKAKSAESFNSNLPVNTKDPATLIFKAAMNERSRDKPKVFGILRFFRFSSVNPNSFIQAIPNKGPYQMPPTTKAEIEATITDNQLMLPIVVEMSIKYCLGQC